MSISQHAKRKGALAIYVFQTSAYTMYRDGRSSSLFLAQPACLHPIENRFDFRHPALCRRVGVWGHCAALSLLSPCHFYARVLHRPLSLVRRKIIAKTRNVPCCRYVPSFTLSSFKNDPASRLFASFVVNISCFR